MVFFYSAWDRGKRVLQMVVFFSSAAAVEPALGESRGKAQGRFKAEILMCLKRVAFLDASYNQ